MSHWDKKTLEQRQRRLLIKTLAAAAAASLASTPVVAGSMLQAVRVVHHDNLNLYFDFNSKPEGVKIFTLANPDRLVIDVNAAAVQGLTNERFESGVIKSIRFGQHADDRLRIVIDLRRQTKASYQFVPRHGGQRLLVDLGVKGDPLQPRSSSHIIERASGRDVVVAVDAGHGGKDPGAIGKRRTLEKDITLQIGNRLRSQLDEQQGVQVKMVRTGDYYVPLRRRIEIARDSHADLFVSLHADAFPRRAASGSSVYTLSLKGASSEAAQFLAEQANKVDPLEGVDMENMTLDLKRTLIELSQNTTIESSIEVGDILLKHLGKVGAVHKPKVEQANFAVLKSPDIPSVLVETAFISNPSEEKKLRNRRFQQRLAVSLKDGIVEYMQQRAPQGTWLASQGRSG